LLEPIESCGLYKKVDCLFNETLGSCSLDLRCFISLFWLHFLEQNVQPFIAVKTFADFYLHIFMLAIAL